MNRLEGRTFESFPFAIIHLGIRLEGKPGFPIQTQKTSVGVFPKPGPSGSVLSDGDLSREPTHESDNERQPPQTEIGTDDEENGHEFVLLDHGRSAGGWWCC